MLVQPFIVMTSFLSLTKSLERFFVILLKEFKNELRKALELPTVDLAAHRRLTEKYQNIYNLNRRLFNVFGLQITLMTCCVAAVTTLQVTSIEQRKYKFNSWHKASIVFSSSSKRSEVYEHRRHGSKLRPRQSGNFLSFLVHRMLWKSISKAAQESLVSFRTENSETIM